MNPWDGAAIPWDQVNATHPYAGVTARRVDTERASIVFYEMQPGAGYPEHKHPQEQVVCVLDGELTFTVEDRTLQLRAGDVVTVRGGLMHGGRGAGETTARFLNIVIPPRD